MASDELLAQASDPRQPTGGSWLGRLRRRFGLSGGRRDTAHLLYVRLVEQARLPAYFAAWGVPDSREGRLEMVNLHLILVMRRLKAAGEVGAELARETLEVYLADLDRHLREWGIGDLSVGKHMGKLAESFFARLAALEPLLAGGDAAGLDPVLRRNVYTGIDQPDVAGVAALAAYLLAQDRHLAGQSDAAMLAGTPGFLPPRPRDAAAVGADAGVDPPNPAH